jgi:hypothetical protein
VIAPENIFRNLSEWLKTALDKGPKLCTNISMTATHASMANTDTNQDKLRQVEATLRSLLAEGLTRGFFGSLALELSVQDGVIQHFRHRTERIEK